MANFIRKHKGFVFLILLSGGVAGFFGIRNYAGHRAEALVREAQQITATNPRKAATNYQVATFLKPGDKQTQLGLANAYIALNLPDEAIKLLQKFPPEETGLLIADVQMRARLYAEALDSTKAVIKTKPSVEAYITKSRILLELDRYTDASDAAKSALAYNLSSEKAITQMVFSKTLEGKNADAKQTLEAMAAGSSKDRLVGAMSQPEILAEMLYDGNLVYTMQRYLKAQPTYTLKGRILMAQAYKSLHNATQAKLELQQAIIQAPASIEAHTLLKEIYESLGEHDAAKLEEKHIDQLKKGSV